MPQVRRDLLCRCRWKQVLQGNWQFHLLWSRSGCLGFSSGLLGVMCNQWRSDSSFRSRLRFEWMKIHTFKSCRYWQKNHVASASACFRAGQCFMLCYYMLLPCLSICGRQLSGLGFICACCFEIKTRARPAPAFRSFSLLTHELYR